MPIDNRLMFKCLDLAVKGLGLVAPNPMVGCVIVCENKIIGEGYHQAFGQAHAEVNAINSVSNQELLKKATLYVNLEPCSHFGKTPPCADLIIEKKIPNVVIGVKDTNPIVGGAGIAKLRKAGVFVKTGVLEKECHELNKRFFTFHEKKRPFIILKWAQSEDGFIDDLRAIEEIGKQRKISSDANAGFIHKWRSQEQSILVGTTAALLDNPQLNVRHIKGKNPIRIVIDKELKIPENYHLLDGSVPTLVFTYLEKQEIRRLVVNNLEFITVPKAQPLLEYLLHSLYERNIQSILVEGGAKLINSLIQLNKWDEARVITGQMKIKQGVKAPELKNNVLTHDIVMEGDLINFYTHRISA